MQLTDPTAERLRAAVNRNRSDKKAQFVTFYLNNIKVQLTREQLKQIVTWYKPGEVYFAPKNSVESNESSSDTSEVNEHLYHFGEIVSYVDHNDESTCIDAVVTYEDDCVVAIVTMEMIIEQRHITPMHVLKYLVKRKASPPYVIVKRETLCDFLLSIHYTGGFDDSSF